MGYSEKACWRDRGIEITTRLVPDPRPIVPAKAGRRHGQVLVWDAKVSTPEGRTISLQGFGTSAEALQGAFLRVDVECGRGCVRVEQQIVTPLGKKVGVAVHLVARRRV